VFDLFFSFVFCLRKVYYYFNINKKDEKDNLFAH
jgi:hypothetical protein